MTAARIEDIAEIAPKSPSVRFYNYYQNKGDILRRRPSAMEVDGGAGGGRRASSPNPPLECLAEALSHR